MKKLALLLVLVMVACFMFVACEPANEDNPTGSTPESTQPNTPDTGDQPGSQTPNTGSQTGTDTPDPQPTGDETTMVSGQLVDLTALEKVANKAQKGLVFIPDSAGTIKTSNTKGKSFSDGTSFTGDGVQLGANGSYTSKAIKFKVATAGTLTVYCLAGGSGFDPDIALCKADGTAVSLTTAPYASSNVPVATINVAEAGEYVIFSNKVDDANSTKRKSINVFGLKFDAAA